MDWTQVSVAIITLIGTVIVTLVPVFVTALFTAQTARAEKLKALTEKNQLLAEAIVKVVQNKYKEFTNSQKYQIAFDKLNAQLHLPAGQIQQLVEQAVSALTLAFGDEWTKLGETTPDAPAPSFAFPSTTTIPLETVDPSF